MKLASDGRCSLHGHKVLTYHQGHVVVPMRTTIKASVPLYRYRLSCFVREMSPKHLRDALHVLVCAHSLQNPSMNGVGTSQNANDYGEGQYYNYIIDLTLQECTYFAYSVRRTSLFVYCMDITWGILNLKKIYVLIIFTFYKQLILISIYNDFYRSLWSIPFRYMC